MNSLPAELWTQILIELEDRTLSETVPCVCKLFKNLCSDNGNIWMQKSSEKAHRYTIEGVNKKTDQQTWKQFYFYEPLCLFPLWGVYIGKSDRDNLIDCFYPHIRGYMHDVSGLSFDYNDLTFHFNDNDQFIYLHLSPKPTNIPREWQQQGITHNMTLDFAKKLFRECNHNYVVVKGESDTHIRSVKKQKDGTLYEIELIFSEQDGASKFEHMWISDTEGNKRLDYETRILEKKCID